MFSCKSYKFNFTVVKRLCTPHAAPFQRCKLFSHDSDLGSCIVQNSGTKCFWFFILKMERSDDKPMEEQLQALWEEQGEMTVGVPQGVRDLLNSAFAQVPVLSFPKLPYGKGIINYPPPSLTLCSPNLQLKAYNKKFRMQVLMKNCCQITPQITQSWEFFRSPTDVKNDLGTCL